MGEKRMNYKTKIRILGASIGFAGFFMVGEYVNYWASFGVVLMMWGNNLESDRRAS
jgi:hypothetical protein